MYSLIANNLTQIITDALENLSIRLTAYKIINFIYFFVEVYISIYIYIYIIIWSTFEVIILHACLCDMQLIIININNNSYPRQKGIRILKKRQGYISRCLK